MDESYAEIGCRTFLRRPTDFILQTSMSLCLTETWKLVIPHSLRKGAEEEVKSCFRSKAKWDVVDINL